MRFLGRNKKNDQADRLRDLVSADTRGDSTNQSVVLILGAKGGVGATTVAWQLAQSLAANGRSTLAVDAHLWQPELIQVAGFALDEGATLTEVLLGKSKPLDAIRQDEGPALLPGGWREQPSVVLTSELGPQLNQRLLANQDKRRGLGNRFDTVIIDGGPCSAPWANTLLPLTDLALIITTPEPLSLVGSYRFCKQAHERGAAEKLRLVINRGDSETAARKAHAGLRDMCRQHLGESLPLAGWLPTDASLARPAAAPIPLMRPLTRRVSEALGFQVQEEDEAQRAA